MDSMVAISLTSARRGCATSRAHDELVALDVEVPLVHAEVALLLGDVASMLRQDGCAGLHASDQLADSPHGVVAVVERVLGVSEIEVRLRETLRQAFGLARFRPDYRLDRVFVQHAVVLVGECIDRGDVDGPVGVHLAEDRQRAGADVEDLHHRAGWRVDQPGDLFLEWERRIAAQLECLRRQVHTAGPPQDLTFEGTAPDFLGRPARTLTSAPLVEHPLERCGHLHHFALPVRNCRRSIGADRTVPLVLVEPGKGVEPLTCSLRVSCSTY